MNPAVVSRDRYSGPYNTRARLRRSLVSNDIRQLQQKRSYRQQIARKLRTQYAEGIYRHKYYTVTLKSRLRVTQGDLKRNHWIDHTRLSIVELFDVEYYCDLEMG